VERKNFKPEAPLLRTIAASAEIVAIFSHNDCSYLLPIVAIAAPRNRKRCPMSFSDVFESVRVIDEPTAIELAGVSARTWDRLRARGDLPPITRISEKRIGYRLVDLKAWLDARRIRREDDHDRLLRGPRLRREAVNAT
jgi:predicted DNA-binding transcriptional regulator AlpA